MADPLAHLRRFLRELKRRNVYKVAVAYVAVAFVVLQGARLLVPALVLPEWFYRVVVGLALLGFPLALVLAWAFEMTPEGMRRTPETETGSEPSAGEGDDQSLVRNGYETGPVPAGDERSIAVLPFDNLSGTEEAEPFVNGIHEDLLTRLSNISDLKVISRTSVLGYRETELSLPAIATSLGVRWIVEGGVQQAGDQVQVNAQLIQAEEDAHRWAETYRRELTTENIFAIQGELTKRIARSLEAELSPAETERVERRPTQDLDAYRLYVEGRTHLDRRTVQGLNRGRELFESALAEDATYALAWSGLSDAWALLVSYGHGSSDTLLPRAVEAARKALECDRELAEAHASLGFAFLLKGIGPASLQELRRAVQLRPSYARAHHWLGIAEATVDRPDRSLEHLLAAAEVDPWSPPIQSALGWTYLWVDGPGEKAVGHARRAVELRPGSAHDQAAKGFVLSAAGRHEEAMAAFGRASDLTREGSRSWAAAVEGLATTYTQRGDTARARELLDRLQGSGKYPFREAAVHAGLGDADPALECLRSVEWGVLDVWLLRFMPALDPLRDDPRFQALLRRVNEQWGLNPDGSLPDGVEVTFDDRRRDDG